MTIATNGMRLGADRLTADAVRTVQAVSDRGTDGAKITEAVTARITDTAAFKAEAATYRAADKMRGTLLDTVI